VQVIGGFSTGSTLSGTTTWTHGSTTVTGSGTTFTSLVAYSWLQGPDGNAYQIKSVTNDTSLKLNCSNVGYEGTTTSGASLIVSNAHYADGYGGIAASDLDTTFGTFSQADQLHYFGWYRAHILMPAGGGTLTQTFALS
jgi:hypothetical protein